MASQTRRVKFTPIEDRFVFIGDAVAPGDRSALKPALFEVEDRASGAARTLKLWRKTGTSIDKDLRELWRHEMRQVQRIMSYAGAREVIVDLVDFVEDDKDFGVVLARTGQPLSAKINRVNRNHWLRNLGGGRARTLFWKNMRRVATALGLVHAQGLVHGRVSAEVVMTEAAEEADFQLGGFEWSLWLGADTVDRAHAAIGTDAAAQRASTYSFAEDWRALGQTIAEMLGISIGASGEVIYAGAVSPSMFLNASERALLKRLTAPSRFEALDANSVTRSIDEIAASIAQFAAVQSGTFILGFTASAGLGESVYEASNGAIPIDEFRRQLEWIRADLDTGPKLLVPRGFRPEVDSLRLITETMTYRLRAFVDQGSAVWDIAVCNDVKLRSDATRVGGDIDYSMTQPIAVLRLPDEAKAQRARLGPDVLDWSIFAGAGTEIPRPTRVENVRQSLLLVQAVEAIVKALESYPIEILESGRQGGRPFVTVRAEPRNERDRLAKRIGMAESAVALKRLFEEDARDAEAKWRISVVPGLGASKRGDVTATFTDLKDHRGRQGYQFEVDGELPPKGPYFLKAERDTGTERVIARRMRHIKALENRVDLADFLDDPWRMRISGRERIEENAKSDKEFFDLDPPKQRALVELWSILPSYFVVGPPGVGKTKLATETIRRRFATDPAARLLVTAQGHDALDHLQKEITKTLRESDLGHILVVRSMTPDRRPTSNEEVHLVGSAYLEALSESTGFKNAPKGIRDRVTGLKAVAETLHVNRKAGTKEERSGLHAISSLVMDGSNIVISTANSPDIESLVEASEQFDWVIVEEAAKATGPELVGPLMLSGRHLLIGDHDQLPPFQSERLGKVLSDHGLLAAALELANDSIGPLMRDGELDEISRIVVEPVRLRQAGNLALRLLEPFRTFVEDDERRARASQSHRRISSTLTLQRRMDPAIAKIVSAAFYKNKLETLDQRVELAETRAPPVISESPLPASPVVVVDFEHVSASGHRRTMERGRPRWHNPMEVDAVIEVLRRLKPGPEIKDPSLAILSPYKAQVDLLEQRIVPLQHSTLAHLSGFKSVRTDGGFVGTVDSFQGSEADVVVLSLVRNNARTGAGALGFLRDRRRMNVALSRAKWKLVIVGSLSFLQEAVRGVRPEDEPHDLSFLTVMAGTIKELAGESRGDSKLPLATIIPVAMLRVRS